MNVWGSRSLRMLKRRRKSNYSKLKMPTLKAIYKTLPSRGRIDKIIKKYKA
jgi:hypothetical protein